MTRLFSTLIGHSLLAAGVAVVSSVLTAAPSQAIQLGFNNITHNNAMNEATGESQLFVDVTDINGGESLSATEALFTFRNIGTAASSITQLYWDDSSLLKNIISITGSGSEVSFSEANKGNLPGGNTVNFSEDFVVDANQPTSQMGVNPGEWVSILFNLDPGKTLNNVFNDLQNGVMRLGFHVQAFGDGGSEAFVNSPVAIASEPTPEPTPTSSTGVDYSNDGSGVDYSNSGETPSETPSDTPSDRPSDTDGKTGGTKEVPEPNTMSAMLLTGLVTWGFGKSRKEIKK